VEQARWLLEGQAAQEEIIDQTEDSGVQPDPERERQHGEQSEPGRLEQLTKSEANISHHGACNFVTLLTFVTKNLTRQSARLDSNNRRCHHAFLFEEPSRSPNFYSAETVWTRISGCVEPLEVARH
jgi:hypothetical protein